MSSTASSSSLRQASRDLAKEHAKRLVSVKDNYSESIKEYESTDCWLGDSEADMKASITKAVAKAPGYLDALIGHYTLTPDPSVSSCADLEAQMECKMWGGFLLFRLLRFSGTADDGVQSYLRRERVVHRAIDVLRSVKTNHDDDKPLNSKIITYSSYILARMSNSPEMREENGVIDGIFPALLAHMGPGAVPPGVIGDVAGTLVSLTGRGPNRTDIISTFVEVGGMDTIIEFLGRWESSLRTERDERKNLTPPVQEDIRTVLQVLANLIEDGGSRTPARLRFHQDLYNRLVEGSGAKPPAARPILLYAVSHRASFPMAGAACGVLVGLLQFTLSACFADSRAREAAMLRLLRLPTDDTLGVSVLCVMLQRHHVAEDISDASSLPRAYQIGLQFPHLLHGMGVDFEEDWMRSESPATQGLLRRQLEAAMGGGRTNVVRYCSAPGCIQHQTVLAVNFKMCSRCRQTYYCSKACQKIHWKAGHKAECVASAQ